METYEIHPLMQHVPEMSKWEYEKLRDDIKENGLIEEVWLHNNMIVDGRHRYKACKETGVVCRFRMYKGDDIARFILSQSNRRSLSFEQRAMMAAALLPQYIEDNKQKMKQGGSNGGHIAGNGRPKVGVARDHAGPTPTLEKSRDRNGRSSVQVAKLVGLGEKTVENASFILQHGTEEDKKEVLEGQVKINAKFEEIKERETGEKPEKRKRQESMYQKNEEPFQKILDKLKTMGKIPREEFLSTIGTKFDQMWFIGAVKSIHFISIEDCGDTMELKIRDEEKDLCSLVMKKLEHAKRIMSQSNRFRFDYDAINKMVQDLYDSIVVGAMR